MKNKILIKSFLSKKAIERLETKYSAQYVCDSSLKAIFGGWSDSRVAIFYTPEPHPKGSNYFGIFVNPVFGGLTITNGLTATEPFTGLRCPDGTIIYSSCRHDFVQHGECFIDGGREYVRRSAEGEPVVLQIVKNKITVKKGKK